MATKIVGKSTSFFLFFLVACGGGAKSSETPEKKNVESIESQKKQTPSMVVKQELGTLDIGAVDAAWSKASSKMSSCHMDALKRLDYFSGELAVFIRLDGEGKVKYAYPEEADTGDRQFESCFIRAIQSTTWPKPVGGEGEIRKRVTYDLADVREPVTLSASKIDNIRASVAHSKMAAECKHGIKGNFTVTLYVVPDEVSPSKGKIASVGVATSSKEAASKLDCISEVASHLNVPSPGGYVAKTQFTF